MKNSTQWVFAFLCTMILTCSFSAFADGVECRSKSGDLRVVITLPPSISPDGLTPGASMEVTQDDQTQTIGAFVTVYSADELDVEGENGFSCALGKRGNKEGGSCGLVAGSSQETVRCKGRW